MKYTFRKRFHIANHFWSAKNVPCMNVWLTLILDHYSTAHVFDINQVAYKQNYKNL